MILVKVLQYVNKLGKVLNDKPSVASYHWIEQSKSLQVLLVDFYRDCEG